MSVPSAFSSISFRHSLKVTASTFLFFTFTSAGMLAQADSHDVAEPATVVERSVRPGIETPLVIQTFPKAICSLYGNEADKGQKPLRLDADDAGMIRVHARPGNHSGPAEVHLECRAEDGSLKKYLVHVTTSETSSNSLDASQPEMRVQGDLRPAFANEALSLSNEELQRRGYPPRPDREKTPALYAYWLKIVSHSFTAVNPRLVARPDRSPTLPRPEASGTRQDLSPTLPLSPRSSNAGNNKIVTDNQIAGHYNNWSGAELLNPPTRYWQIQGEWLLPEVGTNPAYIEYSAAAAWVGLDNGSNDLVQSGSDSESYYISSVFGDPWIFTNYYLWIESLPDAPYDLPNFPVSPLDEIEVAIFLADEYGTTTFSDTGDLTPADNNVWFMIYDLTTEQSYWGTLPRRDSFTGSTAEFVVERPNTPSVPLANYDIAQMENCWFSDTWADQSTLDYNGDGPRFGTLETITMVNPDDGLTLSDAHVSTYGSDGGGTIWFVWRNYY